MLDRREFLEAVDKAYALRKAGDVEGMRSMFAPDATYQLNGDPALAGGFGGEPRPAMAAIEPLMKAFEFHALKRLGAFVEGDKAAIHWEVTLSRPGGEPMTTQFMDLVTIGEDGKLKSLLQFVDTALIARAMA